MSTFLLDESFKIESKKSTFFENFTINCISLLLINCWFVIEFVKCCTMLKICTTIIIVVHKFEFTSTNDEIWIIEKQKVFSIWLKWINDDVSKNDLINVFSTKCEFWFVIKRVIFKFSKLIIEKKLKTRIFESLFRRNFLLIETSNWLNKFRKKKI